MTRSHSKALRISTADDLRLLWQEARTGRRRLAGGIAIDLDGLSEDERDAREAPINKAYFACGCAEATAAGLLGLALFIGWAIGGGGDAPLWQNVLLGALVFFAAGGLGKFVGRSRANAALRREVEALAKASRIKLDRPNEAHEAACAVT